MAIPIAITGSYNFNGINLTASYATITHFGIDTSTAQFGSKVDFTGSFITDVYFDSASFVLTNTEGVLPVESFNFEHVFEFDEGDTDMINQAYSVLIASASQFENMTKKIFS